MMSSDPQQDTSATRVLVVARNLYFGAGGMEKTAANLANHLAASGRMTAVAYRAAPGRETLYPLSPDICHLAGDCSPDWLAEAAQAFGAEVVVVFYATAIETPAIAALADTGIPVILHEGSNPQRVIETNWAKPRQITPAQAVDERIALMSMCTRIRFTLPDYLASLPEALRKDAVAFPNAFPPADPANIELRKQQPRNYFINIGGLKRVKNLEAAARAFALIADKIPEWDFHIFSAQPKDPTTRNRLDQIIAQHGLAGRIRCFPPTDNIAREYGRAKIHVIASKEEGLPNCVAEASRHALPSIGFACCAGTNAMIRHGKNGLLADCGENEVENLATQMLHLAENDAEREAFGQAAFEESHIYDPDAVFACWNKLIDAAFRDSPSREALLDRRYPDPRDASRIRNLQRNALGSRPFPAPKRGDRHPLLSIIVPIFNKEAHLAATLTTIRDNEYPDKQVILVDDASTDGSLAIAEGFADKHGWQIIRHTHNKGLSEARNSGLDAARGDIIQFWDGDDLYDSRGNCDIIRVMTENGSDLATGLATRNGKVIARYARAAADIPVTTLARTPEVFATASSCFKLYRRDFLRRHDLRFMPGLYMQDSEFNLRAFALAERITATSAILGEYALVEGSGARSYHPARYASVLAIEDMTRDFYARYGLSALDTQRQRHVIRLVFPSFIERATTGCSEISEQTSPSDLNFEFLKQVQIRLQNMAGGLLACRFPAPGMHLALYAIREGYLHWLCTLLTQHRPTGFMPKLLARTPDEERLIDQLADALRPQKHAA